MLGSVLLPPSLLQRSEGPPGGTLRKAAIEAAERSVRAQPAAWSAARDAAPCSAPSNSVEGGDRDVDG